MPCTAGTWAADGTAAEEASTQQRSGAEHLHVEAVGRRSTSLPPTAASSEAPQSTLWMVSGGCRWRKPPSGGRDTLVTNLRTRRCSSCDTRDEGGSRRQGGASESRQPVAGECRHVQAGDSWCSCAPRPSQRRSHLAHLPDNLPKVLDGGGARAVPVAAGQRGRVEVVGSMGWVAGDGEARQRPGGERGDCCCKDKRSPPRCRRRRCRSSCTARLYCV